MKRPLSILCLVASLTLTNARAADLAGPTVEVSPAPPKATALTLTLARQAQESFNRGDYLEAERLYTAVLAVDPNDVYALNNRGVTQFCVGKLATAGQTLRRAVALAPHNAWGYETLGVILYRQGKLTEASDCFHWVLAIDPQNEFARAFFQRAEGQKLSPPTARPWPSIGDFLTPLEGARLLNVGNA